MTWGTERQAGTEVVCQCQARCRYMEWNFPIPAGVGQGPVLSGHCFVSLALTFANQRTTHSHIP